MLELSSIKEEVSNRLRSPLFGSFIIAWLVINWQVPVTLLFYKHDDIIKDGYRSYVHMVTSNYNYLSCFVFPLLIALGFCFAVKPLATLATTWIQTWTEKETHKIAGKGTIPSIDYYRQREKYEEAIKKLQQFNSAEQQLIKEKKEVLEELSHWQRVAQARTDELEEATERLQEMDALGAKGSVSVLNGTWIVKNVTANTETEWKILHGHINSSDGLKIIELFKHYVAEKRIDFLIRDQGQFSFFQLTYEKEWDGNTWIVQGILNGEQLMYLSRASDE